METIEEEREFKTAPEIFDALKGETVKIPGEEGEWEVIGAGGGENPTVTLNKKVEEGWPGDTKEITLEQYKKLAKITDKHK